MSTADLRRELEGSASRSAAGDLIGYPSTSLEEYFELRPEHLLRLLDALESGAFSLADLDAVTTVLEMSPHFRWDDEIPEGVCVSKVVFWLANPVINYPLTPKVRMKVRHHLVTGANTLSLDDMHAKSGPTDV